MSLTVGAPVALTGGDARADTDRIMEAITDLLPRASGVPSAADIAGATPP